MPEPAVSKPREWSQPHLQALNYLNNCALDGDEVSIARLREILDVPDTPAASPVAGVSAEKNYHFSDQQVIDATVGTDYLRSRLSGALAHMTSGEKWSLYRAIVKLAQPSAEGDGWIATKERMLAAINWVMGCGHDEFRSVRHDAPRFWWRTELAERAGLTYDGTRYVISPAPVAKEGRES